MYIALVPNGICSMLFFEYTLWRRQELTNNMAVEYDAQVVDEGQEGDRVSDLNCFWLASDPQRSDLWSREKWRSGIFVRCYTLQMYYLGYGGNHNSTTRFRRYTGNERGVDSAAYRPGILKEYTDPAHLLRPNHWYHVKIESQDGRTRFYMDGELIVDYLDPTPLQRGWFGFRTTLSRTRITNFQTHRLNDDALTTGRRPSALLRRISWLSLFTVVDGTRQKDP